MPTLPGQLAQSLTEAVWSLVGIVGLTLPGFGWLFSLVRYGLLWKRAALTVAYYALALPIVIYVYLLPLASGVDVCLVLMFVPIGVLLAMWLLSAPPPPRMKRFDGTCRRCGYDLRATPQQCPECGEVPWHGAVW